MAKTADMIKDGRINREIRKLKSLTKALPAEKAKTAEGLVKRIAFMQITLEDLEADINTFGSVEPFSQGDSPPYDRERPAVRIYNAMIRNYATVCKQFIDLMPDGDKTKANDELMAFVKRGAQ